MYLCSNNQSTRLYTLIILFFFWYFLIALNSWSVRVGCRTSICWIHFGFIVILFVYWCLITSHEIMSQGLVFVLLWEVIPNFLKQLKIISYKLDYFSFYYYYSFVVWWQASQSVVSGFCWIREASIFIPGHDQLSLVGGASAFKVQ